MALTSKLSVRVHRRNRTSWCEADHLIVEQQRRVTGRAPAPAPLGAARATADLTFEVSPDTGGLASLCVHGNELLVGPSRPWLTRAPTENDRAFFGPERALEQWQAAGYDRLQLTVRAIEQRDRATYSDVILDCPETGVGLRFQTTFTPRSGSLLVETHFAPTRRSPPGLPFLARLGHRYELSPAIADLEWFGPGPSESYADRWLGQRIARHRGAVAEQRHPYAVPQESGNHHAVAWAALRSEGGIGVLLHGDDPLDVNAGIHDEAEVTRARHHDELVAADRTFVHIDHRHAGVGNGSCGPGTLERYRVPPQPTRWRYAISPLAGGADPVALYRAGIASPPVTQTLL